MSPKYVPPQVPSGSRLSFSGNSGQFTRSTGTGTRTGVIVMRWMRWGMDVSISQLRSPLPARGGGSELERFARDHQRAVLADVQEQSDRDEAGQQAAAAVADEGER